ncbi:hypothetical protein PC9H_002279 [Pleurotus ostreatus]|uniref:Uncharacterized protein n=1 Tax=Pleurotus ostreatus TaxID=5322 RepID=A0A8H6ZLB6_PLEOS|nr:uncharacterized protein PC9H_002279 [Pleurotus ostreatus]KAF7419687.1 hypothetical protein PC9H_002279 [Pleurotus ostreatus]KAJ8689439.1 hypothetical protein PTI98_012342 [Pleurotus ostreatus]
MTYIGDCVFIKNLSKHKFQAFISNDNGGSAAWHTLADSFKSGRWGRSGWDVIVFRNEKDTWRKGVYMYIKDVTVYITIHGPDDIRIEYGRDSCAAISTVIMPLLPEFDLDSGGPNTRHRRPSSQPYIGDCVLIRNASSKRFQAFVSSHNGGSNSWFTLTKSFKDGRWNRSGWEVIVCRNAEDTWRKGMYIHVKDVTVYVTVKGVDHVEFEYGRESVETEHRRDDVETEDGGNNVHRKKVGRQIEMAEAGLASPVTTFQEKDNESETPYNDYQPSPKEFGAQDIQGFDGWA